MSLERKKSFVEDSVDDSFVFVFTLRQVLDVVFNLTGKSKEDKVSAP